METFKKLDEITKPDSRQGGFVMRRGEPDSSYPRPIAYYHRRVEEITLAPSVPEALQDQFQSARHLLLYSWFVYRFSTVAQLQAFATLELALRVRLGVSERVRPPGLGKLFAKAIHLGLLSDGSFSHCPAELRAKNGVEWLTTDMIPYVTKFRNDFAHGSTTLFPDGGKALRMSADAINRLFA